MECKINGKENSIMLFDSFFNSTLKCALLCMPVMELLHIHHLIIFQYFVSLFEVGLSKARDSLRV